MENLARAIAPVISHMAEDIWQNLPYPKGQASVFQAGWVELDPQWQQPALAQRWTPLRSLRQEVNRVLEQARTAKTIGSSLEAKALIYVADANLRQQLAALNPGDAVAAGANHVDELRYLLLVSQVDLLDSPDALADLPYQSQTDSLAVGVTAAAGQKCDRCWNYSIHVGHSRLHPLLCDRCVPALAGDF